MTPTGFQSPGDPQRDPARTGVRITAELVSDAIDLAAAHDDVADDEAGGIAIFTGVVRNHDSGDRVTELTYEAWEERAPRALRAAAEAVAQRHGGVRAVHVVHRIGLLHVGEIAVVCAVSAPHREEALAAAGDLIDTVKQQVPIWKREVLADGTVRWPGGDHCATGPARTETAP